MIKTTLFSTHLILVPLVKKYQDRYTTQISQKEKMEYLMVLDHMHLILKDYRAQNERFHSTVHIIPDI